MKKKSIILFLLFSAFNIFTMHCQSKWFDPDAVWYYSTPYAYLHSEACTKAEVKGDTLIQGLTCKALLFKDTETDRVLSTEYFHFRNDSVLYYNYYDKSFHTLYDFTAKVGDTVTVHKNKFKPTDGFLWSDSIDSFQYIISGIDSIQVSETWLKRQKIKSVDHDSWVFFSSYDTVAYIVEKIGNKGYFFGRVPYITLMENIGMLRCYSDHTIQFKNPNWDKACDFVNAIDVPQITTIRIYPNPASKEIYFESINNKNIHSVEIMDVGGRILTQMEVNNIMAKIDVSNLGSGIYFARIVFADKTYLTSKFILNQQLE